MLKFSLSPGTPLPYGVTTDNRGHNFALFSENATSVSLELFPNNPSESPILITLDPLSNRTGYIWHIHIENLPSTFYYSYRLDGPHQPEKGLFFNSENSIVDPYSRIISGLEVWNDPTRNSTTPLRGFHSDNQFDWAGDHQLNRPLSDTIIYELHVRGFTQNPNSETNSPGTYSALMEKIPYLKELGITAVELLPIHQFDEKDCTFHNAVTGEKLLNYWGYSTIGFFALKTGYAVDGSRDQATTEFKAMVKAFHSEGIEIILDVVFNHTAEGGVDGQIVSFRGLENNVYYLFDEKEEFKNYSGCGNTMNCNHPIVRKMILESLRYWVIEMHVDGFRFDLASILSRDGDGNVLPNPPLLEAIAKDPILANTKIIAEAWDAAGLYQVGSFPASKRWAEWNGKYRDEIRLFCSGNPGLTGKIATRISGSEDLYAHSERNPYHSINFFTAHDGFTAMDLVSYENKHNLENGEDNRDGTPENLSMNFGVEGETDDPVILANREKQVRNLAAILMMSQGTPMILAGDEFGRTQFGNNNAWCQDNQTSWIDWDLLKKNHKLFLFWKELIRFRKAHPMLGRSNFFSGKENPFSKIPDISWHNTQINQPEFETASRSLAFLIDGMDKDKVIDDTIYVALNFDEKELNFEIPSIQSKNPWKLVFSTAEPESFIQHKLIALPSSMSKIRVPKFSITLLMRSY